MKMLVDLFATFLSFTLILGILFSVFWYIATKKNWNTLKLVALSITILLIGLSLILGVATQDSVILIGGIVLSLLQGLIILNWPSISSKTVKRLNLRR
jgi:hypothetical protein